MEIATALDAAYLAEEAFERELVRTYGQRNAADARYRLRHDSAAMRAAKKAFHDASEKLHLALVEARRAPSITA